MPHIKEEPVYLRIINLVQRHGQFHHAQIGGQVAAGSGDMPHKKFTDLLAELPVLRRGQSKKIRSGIELG